MYEELLICKNDEVSSACTWFGEYRRKRCLHYAKMKRDRLCVGQGSLARLLRHLAVNKEAMLK